MKKINELCTEQRDVYEFTKQEVEKITSVAALLMNLRITKEEDKSQTKIDFDNPVDKLEEKKENAVPNMTKEELLIEKVRNNPYSGLNENNKSMVRSIVRLSSYTPSNYISIFDSSMRSIMETYNNDHSKVGAILRKFEKAGICKLVLYGKRNMVVSFKLDLEYFTKNNKDE